MEGQRSVCEGVLAETGEAVIDVISNRWFTLTSNSTHRALITDHF